MMNWINQMTHWTELKLRGRGEEWRTWWAVLLDRVCVCACARVWALSFDVSCGGFGSSFIKTRTVISVYDLRLRTDSNKARRRRSGVTGTRVPACGKDLGTLVAVSAATGSSSTAWISGCLSRRRSGEFGSCGCPSVASFPRSQRNRHVPQEAEQAPTDQA